ncbi:reverse transcriptase-rnase h-integrase [Moniliophthora roreri]|nr:reverse transcriptase-rnase h-integrase [Moniliophthora roreri]
MGCSDRERRREHHYCVCSNLRYIKPAVDEAHKKKLLERLCSSLHCCYRDLPPERCRPPLFKNSWISTTPGDNGYPEFSTFNLLMLSSRISTQGWLYSESVSTDYSQVTLIEGTTRHKKEP